MQDTFAKLIGLGEKSIKKSYYPQLQKKIEELEKSEKKYRLLADNISDVIWILDLDFRYSYVSASIERLSGYKADDLLGRSFSELMPPESARQAETLLQGLLRRDQDSDESPRVQELQICHRDGSLRWIEISVSLLFNLSPAGPQLLGLSRDISSRKLAEKERLQYQEQLIQAQKMESIGTLTGGIAHDFNNLLTVINGYSEKLLRSMSPDHPFQRDIAAINQAGKKAESLTRQLLGFSRKQPFHAQPININRTISAMNSLLRRLIGEDIAVNTRLAGQLPMIKADGTQLEQIFTNLVINARDALKGAKRPAGDKTIVIETGLTRFDENGAAAIGLGKAGDYVYFSVSDNGSGIPEHLRTRIFEPFFTTKAKNQGTGLGLSTVYGIVKQNQGSIDFLSRIDEGTRFIVYWPASPEEQELKNAAAAPSEPSATGSETILIVEDDVDVCLFTSEALKNMGYMVSTEHCGTAALERIRKAPDFFDLIVTDLVMPRMNGIEFIDQVRRIVPGMKAIFVSGYTDSPLAGEQTGHGDVNFLQKPYSVRELSEKVREVLDRKPG